MNDFGHGTDLTGLRVVFPKKRIWGSTDDPATRTYIVEGGPGALGSRNKDNSFDGTLRHVTGYWEIDGLHEKFSIHKPEYYLTANGKKVYELPEEYTEVEAVPDPVLLESKSNKPRGRAAWKPQEPEPQPEPAKAAEPAPVKPKTTAVMVVGDVMSSVVAAAIANKGAVVAVDLETRMPGPPQDCKPVIAVAIETPEPPKGLTPQHVADIIRMYGEGAKIADIAEHCGDRNKANRIRKVLAEAGLK